MSEEKCRRVTMTIVTETIVTETIASVTIASEIMVSTTESAVINWHFYN